jgi:hypothetical protein
MVGITKPWLQLQTPMKMAMASVHEPLSGRRVTFSYIGQRTRRVSGPTV